MKMKMKINYKKFGEGQPLIILHGLYGSSDNWYSVGKELSKKFMVYLPDARNHGKSEHAQHHDYQSMKQDLLDFMNGHDIKKPIIIGHSMGGKTAMQFALDHPDNVKKLVVVDISPRDYSDTEKVGDKGLSHANIIKALKNINPTKIDKRSDAEDQLSSIIPSKPVRQFLLKNLEREKDGGYRWLLNLDALSNDLPKILGGIDKKVGKQYEGPALFIKGEMSNYITDADDKEIQSIFPRARIETVKNAGHWIHAENPDDFLNKVNEFIE
jgi:pimeloyl-ACP methyl ester carboxylesterase